MGGWRDSTGRRASSRGSTGSAGYPWPWPEWIGCRGARVLPPRGETCDRAVMTMSAARSSAPLKVLLGALAACLLLAGCSGGSLTTATVTSTASGAPDTQGSGSASASASPRAAPSTTIVVPPVASITSTPALGATGLTPIEPISLTVDKGTIDDVTLTNPH